MLESGRVHVDLVYRGGGCRRRALARGGPLAELGISPAGCPAAESSMAAADFPSLLSSSFCHINEFQRVVF